LIISPASKSATFNPQLTANNGAVHIQCSTIWVSFRIIVGSQRQKSMANMFEQ
jgi:hypothetical protein